VHRAASQAANAFRARRVITVQAGPAAGLRFGQRLASANYRSGTNEQPVQDVFVERLRTGAVVHDVGANVGFFSLLGARLVGPTGAVHAFEAVPECAAALRKNAARNRMDNVTVHAVAVSDHVGEIELLRSRHPGGATTSVRDKPHNYTGSITVPCVTLDDLVERGVIPPADFVKIDVEGAEPQVLSGAQRLLSARTPVVLCEVDDPTDSGAAAKSDRIRALLGAHGYVVRELAPSYLESRSRVVHLVAEAPGGVA
jgi:FkbM family methyltransferase